MQDGFSPATNTLLDQAALRCARRGAKLTDLRRSVLGLVLDSPQPSGAYDLLDRLRDLRGPAAPPTVYRALDFLVEHGFIHRVERLAAFVGCIDEASLDHDHHHHAAQFLICTNCRKVAEIEDHDVAHALQAAAKRLGFSLKRATIEAEGLCAVCKAAAVTKPQAAPVLPGQARSTSEH
jgi:Fur family zinc uptake transcriptional regulator